MKAIGKEPATFGNSFLHGEKDRMRVDPNLMPKPMGGGKSASFFLGFLSLIDNISEIFAWFGNHDSNATPNNPIRTCSYIFKNVY